MDVHVLGRFTQEAPTAWRAARRKPSGFDVSAALTIRVLRNSGIKETRRASRFTEFGDGTHYLAFASDADEIDAANGAYAFTIGRVHGNEYFIIRFRRNDDPEYPTKDLRNWMSLAESPWSIWGVSWAKIASSTDFVPIGAGTRNLNGQTAVVVAYECVNSEGKSPKKQLGGVYWGAFSPSNHWVVLECGVENVHDMRGNEISVRTTLDYWTDEFATLPRTVETRFIEAGETTETTVATFGDLRPVTRNENECYLSYYGLEEPILTGDPSILRRLSLLITGAVCIILAVLIWRKSR